MIDRNFVKFLSQSDDILSASSGVNFISAEMIISPFDLKTLSL